MKYSLIGSEAHAALDERARREERSLASMREIDAHERMRAMAETMTTRGVARAMEVALQRQHDLADPNWYLRQRALATARQRSITETMVDAIRAYDDAMRIARTPTRSLHELATGLPAAPEPEPLSFAYAARRPPPPPPRVVVIDIDVTPRR
jgi:hypothetical protein